MKKLLFVCDKCEKEISIHLDEEIPEGWTLVRTDKGYLTSHHDYHLCEECSKELKLP